MFCMVSVLKFQAVGSLEYTFKHAEDDEKLESRCRRERMKKKPISQYEQDTFQKVFHARGRTCLTSIDSMPLLNSV